MGNLGRTKFNHTLESVFCLGEKKEEKAKTELTIAVKS